MKSCKIMAKHVKWMFSPVPGVPCKTLDNTCKFQAFWGARAAGNAQKLEIWWKWWNSAEFQPFWWFSPKKHPKRCFGWKSTPKRTFTAQDPLKNIGKALVSLVFALRGRQSTISTPRGWKWGEMTPFSWNVVKITTLSPKWGILGGTQPRAEIPSPEPY